MQPAVPLRDVRGVLPAWLRPGAFGLVLCLHLAVLFGIRWPAETNIPRPPPLEIQVIPQAEPARLLTPRYSAPAVEVRPANAVPVDVHTIEAQPLRHGQEITELKPSDSVIATNPPPGVVVPAQPQAAESRPIAAPLAAAPVQAAQPSLEAASAKAPALPVDPPTQGPLPSSERRVAESEPPKARTPATPARVAPAAREAPSAQASALPANPPSQPLPSGQPVLESEPLAARPLAAPAQVMQVMQAAREAPSAVASAPAINPPSQGPSPEQHIAQSHPLEAGPPAAAVEGAQSAHEAPGAGASALAINPSSPPSPGQPVVELAPLGVAQTAAPVGVGPPAREVAVAASSIGASTSTAQAAGPLSEQVARLEPYSPVAAAPLQGDGPIISGRIGEIVRYVERYDGGRCFFVAPVAITETEAKLEGYGASARPFEALDAAFRHENGFEASIDVRLVTPAQCPAVTFLGRLRGANAPRLHIDGVNLGPGGALTGTVDGYGSRNVALLLATDSGTVQNMSHLLKPGIATKGFTIEAKDIAKASGGQPQLLIVVASPLPLDALQFDRLVAADQLFSTALAEAARKHQPVAAMARYFKLER
jgi:hypothetical protein